MSWQQLLDLLFPYTFTIIMNLWKYLQVPTWVVLCICRSESFGAPKLTQWILTAKGFVPTMPLSFTVRIPSQRVAQCDSWTFVTPPPPDRFKNVNTLPPTGTWIQHTHICIHADSCAYLIIVYTCTLTCRQTIIEWCLKMSKEGSNIAYIYIWEKKCCIAAIFFKDTPWTASSSASHVNIPPPPNSSKKC